MQLNWTKIARIAREGWRPALGWTLVAAIIHEFILRHWLNLKGSDAAQLVTLAGLIISQVGIRAWEKTKGTP